MDPKTSGDIAIKILKHDLRKSGFMLRPDNMREVGRMAKDLDVSIAELMNFVKPMAQEIFNECFDLPKAPEPELDGELAIKVLKRIRRQKGLHLSPDNNREFGRLAADIGISLPELKEFIRPIAQEMLDEYFTPKEKHHKKETKTAAQP